MKFSIKKYILSVLLVGVSTFNKAQFSIEESFKNTLAPTSNVILGGRDASMLATTTSGNVDPNGDGWLRLTKAIGNQAGYAYINQAFPATLGVLVEFDYKSWGGKKNDGADGFTVFLFDAAITPANFRIGAYGGSLGYANNGTSTQGLKGAYIGIGFDEYGNFSNTGEGKNGGELNTTDRFPNFISVRGNETNNYKYLKGSSYAGKISYNNNDPLTTRPTDAQFFRRAKVMITPIIAGTSYNIKIFVKNSPTADYPTIPVLNYDSTEVPPSNLKLGFAASTGGSYNYHEIRNVIVTTPGNLRISKQGDKTQLTSSAVNNSNKIVYTIKINNDSDSVLNSILFTDILKNSAGTQLTNAQFQVDNINLSGFINNNVTIQNNNNSLSGTVGLAPNKEGTITITGRLLEDLPGNKLINTTNINTTDIVDNDQSNNTATFTSDILKSNAVIVGTPDTYSWDTSFTTTYPILSNDSYDGLSTGTGFIPTGPHQNITITPIGTWPTGITITPEGEIQVSSGTTMPTSPIFYKLCNYAGNCVNVPVTFNGFTPGTISTSDASTQCDGAEVTVKPNSLAMDGLKIINYRWQVSYDNGTTWTSISNYNADGVASVTFNLTEGTALVRREARSNSAFQTNYQYSYTTSVTFTVIKNTINFSTSDSFVIQKGGSVTIPTVTTTYPGTVVIKDENQNTITQGQTINYPNTGIYEYVVTANMSGTLNCPAKKSIFVVVQDLADCTKQKEKVFATSQSWGSILTGGVSNSARAVDNDMSTYSTMTVGLGLLGIGTTWQNLNFGHKITKGTPVSIKLGQEYSGAQVAGGITVYAVDQNNNTIGPMTAIGEGALLDLLVGDNVFEFKFIPKGNDGKPIDYYGVRVNSGGLVAVASNTKIFGVYYEKDKTVTTDCTIQTIIAAGASVPSGYVGTVKLNNWVSDVCWGVQDVGLGVATSLSSVVHPYLAVDDNLDTFAIFNKAVSALNRQILDVKLRQIARPGDEIRILLGGFDIAALDLSLLTDFKVQRYLGNIKIGAPVTGNGFKLLDLNLLALLGGPDNRKALVVSSIAQPFDRIEISYLSVVQASLLGNYPYLYDVSIMPRMAFQGFDPNNLNVTIDLCANDYLKVAKTDNCTSYDVSFATANKDALGNVTSFSAIVSSDIAIVQDTPSFTYYSFTSLLSQYSGNLYLKIQTKRQNCDYGSPQYIKVNLKNCKDAIVNPILNSAGQ